MSQGIISLRYQNLTLAWKYPEGEIVNKIRRSFVVAHQEEDFIGSFLDHMGNSFKMTKSNEGQIMLELSLKKTGEDWNISLSKFGLHLQTYSSCDFPDIIRKSQLSFDDF